jgi:hypothetical protein
MIQAIQPRFRFDKGQICLDHLLTIVLYLPFKNWRKLNISLINIRLLTLRYNARDSAYCCTSNLGVIASRWRRNSASILNGSRSGGSAGPSRGSLSRIKRGAGASRFFPPLERTIVKAIACELPRQRRQPLARYSLQDLVRRVEIEPQVRSMSCSTIWRILAQDAIKPWQHRCWIFPRDPDFVEKARVVLDLYAGFWQGKPLTDDDHVISADEKTSIQARVRLHPTLAPAPRASHAL